MMFEILPEIILGIAIGTSTVASRYFGRKFHKTRPTLSICWLIGSLLAVAAIAFVAGFTHNPVAVTSLLTTFLLIESVIWTISKFRIRPVNNS